MGRVCKIAVSNPFPRRKSLDYWSKYVSLRQRKEKQEGYFLERDPQGKVTVEGPGVSRSAKYFFINILLCSF